MKELSIEEKAKAYDKLLGKAKQIYNKENDVLIIHTLEDLLPELKESEDEKTRKEIVGYLKRNLRFEWATWLEKQGEKDKPTYNTYSKDVQLTQEEYDKKRVSDEATIKEVEAYKKGLEDAQKIFEKQGKQKPDDKVELKFKIGDWVVFDGETLHITNVTENGYSTEDGVIPFRCEKETKIWTIADAKGGDVLTNGNCPCIFKSINEENAMVVYCGINGFEDFATKSESESNRWDDKPENYYPATKEQRDFLFQKMKESGYEWDAEKKELKKIKQESWSEEDENYLNTTIAYLKDANEALRTEYEKGRADVIADTLSWLANCWPRYCSNPTIIDAYKEGVVKD